MFEGTTRSFATIEDASSVSGTLPYMAPEILRGDAADYRSDLWALGVVLYEAASGRLPFEGRTGFEISSAIMREIPNPLGPPVPPGLWAIIQRCLAKEPIQRYQRAGEVQAALEAVQSAANRFRRPRSRSESHPGLLFCTVCDTFMSERETFFCCWERQREHSFFARTLSAAVGRWAVPISTDIMFTPWPTTAAEANIASGLRRELLGHSAAIQRRFRKELDQSAAGPHSISLRYRRLFEEHLADRARPARGTQRALLRRRTGRAFRNPRRRRNLVA